MTIRYSKKERVIEMDVIWNLTRVCPWNCRICCVSAAYATDKTKYNVVIAQKESGKELSLAEKLTVLKLFRGENQLFKIVLIAEPTLKKINSML